MEYQLITYSAEETMNLGQKFVALAKPGSTFCLTGDLGAGKTTLVRGIARALNIKSVVQSPTFNIMKVYFDGDRPLIHIDAYRLADVNTDIGLDEYIGYETGITVSASGLFPSNRHLNVSRAFRAISAPLRSIEVIDGDAINE